MHVINVRNVNHALPAGINYLKQHGIEEQSRNGPVLTAPGPVTTVYERPLERVLFNPIRDANPFLHFIESLWMLDGRSEVNTLAEIVPRFAEFSDDGSTLNGAYGHRWRKKFGYDQLEMLVEEIKRNPSSRRLVLSMWDSRGDLPYSITDGRSKPSKDVPCNTHIYFRVTKNGNLDMTLLNRSNDVIWGAYGANAVHFSYLLEYMAIRTGFPAGKLYQISHNYHVYSARPDVAKLFNADIQVRDLYARVIPAQHVPLINTNAKVFHRELRMFLEDPTEEHFADPFFGKVAVPLRKAHRRYQNTKVGWATMDDAFAAVDNIRDSAWRIACNEWLGRREKAMEAKQQGPCASTPKVGVDANGSEVVG